jgi:hypothetical protein
VGGRLGTVTLAGDSFEAGGSIIHPRNLHARRFADLLGLAVKTGGDDWLGIWDGKSFVFQTARPPPAGSSWWRRKLQSRQLAAAAQAIWPIPAKDGQVCPG